MSDIFCDKCRYYYSISGYYDHEPHCVPKTTHGSKLKTKLLHSEVIMTIIIRYKDPRAKVVKDIPNPKPLELKDLTKKE